MLWWGLLFMSEICAYLHSFIRAIKSEMFFHNISTWFAASLSCSSRANSTSGLWCQSCNWSEPLPCSSGHPERINWQSFLNLPFRMKTLPEDTVGVAQTFIIKILNSLRTPSPSTNSITSPALDLPQLRCLLILSYTQHCRRYEAILCTLLSFLLIKAYKWPFLE